MNIDDIDEPTFANPGEWATRFWKHNYRVTLDMGVSFWVNADDEQEALDFVIDYCEEHRFVGFVASPGEITEEEAEEYACGGNHGLYLTTNTLYIEEVAR